MTDPWGGDPWAPPVPHAAKPRDRDVVVVACALTLVLAAGVVSLVSRAIAGEAARDRAREAAADAAADKKFDEALQATPDTATVSPAPDGSKRYDSPARERDQHAFHVMLPRGWEGKRLDHQETRVVYSDSLLTGPRGVIIVNRLDVDVRVDSRGFGESVEEALADGEGVTVTESWAGTTIGDDEPAFRVEGTLTDEGDEYTVRVILFEHGGETFRVDLTSASGEWMAALPGFDRVLDSWRWG